jgi:hypothetical protein
MRLLGEPEAIGVELIERVKRTEAITRDVIAVTEELKETAARYRDQAKRVFAEIEDCSRVTAEVRKTCIDKHHKIESFANGTGSGTRPLIAPIMAYVKSRLRGRPSFNRRI